MHSFGFISAAFIDQSQVWVAVGLIAFWLVLMCLKQLGQELDYAIRWHTLKAEAETLRLRQNKRLRELGIKKR